MKKTFITNLILVLGLNLTVKPIWIFGIDRLVQNAVGPSEFGTYSAILSLSFIFNVILDLGITNFNNRNIAQNHHLLTKHFSRVVVLKFTLAIIYVIVCSAWGLIIGYNARMMRLLLVLCFMQFLISFILYLRSNISGLHLFRTDSILSATDRIIGIAICAPFLWFHFFTVQIDIMKYVYVQALIYFIMAIIAFIIVVSKAGFIRFEWTRNFSRMILKQSFPFAMLTFLMSFYNRVDSVMLERLMHDGGREAGIYAQSFRMLDAANMVAFLFAGLLLPMFSRMLKHKESVEELVKTSYTIIMILALTVAVNCAFYGENIMSLLYPSNVNEASIIFKFLMWGFVAISCQYIFSTLLTANGNLKQLNIIAGSAMIFNIGFNFIMIPYFSARGAAIVSLTTQLFVAATQIILVQRIFKFHMLPKLMLTLVLFIIGLVVINYLETHFLHLDWRIEFIGTCGAAVVLAFAIGLLNIKSLLRVVKFG